MVWTQVEEDTDRDRYMSPLESKQYGIIDYVIGGDDAGFVIQGDTRRRPMTKKEYISWGEEAEKRPSRGSRFTGEPPPLEASGAIHQAFS